MKKSFAVMLYIVITAAVMMTGSCKQSHISMTAPTPTVTPLVIDNGLHNNNINLLGGIWFTMNDCAYGGMSVCSPTAVSMGGTFQMDSPGANGLPYAAHISGTVYGFNTNTGLGYQFGFLEMGTFLSAGSGVSCTPVDISLYNGIEFWAKIGSDDNTGGWVITIPYTQDGPTSVTCPVQGVTNTAYSAGQAPTCSDMQGACQCLSPDYGEDYQYQLSLTTTWNLIKAYFVDFKYPQSYYPPPSIIYVLQNAKQIQWQPNYYPPSVSPFSFNADLWIDTPTLYR